MQSDHVPTHFTDKIYKSILFTKIYSPHVKAGVPENKSFATNYLDLFYVVSLHSANFNSVNRRLHKNNRRRRKRGFADDVPRQVLSTGLVW